MKIGTKSILFGAHCFFIHPWMVALGWYKLYGFPFDPRLWLCFFVHDLGYWGMPNMDGEEGESHPEVGAKIVEFFCGKKWGEFCLLHSRFYAKKLGKRYSQLAVADKMAIVVTPGWLYIPMVRLSGEIQEYQALDRTIALDRTSDWAWYRSFQKYIYGWIEEHRSVDRDDTWSSR